LGGRVNGSTLDSINNKKTVKKTPNKKKTGSRRKRKEEVWYPTKK